VEYLKQIFSPYYSYASANESVMFSLFLSRLPALRDMYMMKATKLDRHAGKILSPNLKTKITPYELLQTDEILKEVYESANTNPAMFLAALEHYM
jgi:hypothetical protein